MRSVSRRQFRCNAVALSPLALGLQVTAAADEAALFASSETRSVETPAHGAGPDPARWLDQHALPAADVARPVAAVNSRTVAS